MESPIKKFVAKLESAFENHSFVKLLISKPADKSSDLKKITAHLATIQNESKLSFVYSYDTKDITKNYSLKDGIQQITSSAGVSFKNCILFTTYNDIQLTYNNKMEPAFSIGKPTTSAPVTHSHNHEKQRPIQAVNNTYLRQLGVTTQDGTVVHTMQGKFRQINKYIETIDHTLKSCASLIDKKQISIIDMGCGKGYLTCSLYDYLVNTRKLDAHITGVDVRQDLADLCNRVAKECGFENLKFSKGTIQEQLPSAVDILIALHACDTATDDAIYKGICSNASIIITAPCCHKQVRKDLDVTGDLAEIVKHGILLERQAEILTDTLRGLTLEAHGYSTKIFEFISDEHTHKNVMIVGTKVPAAQTGNVATEKIEQLKKLFGLKRFYLQELFDTKGSTSVIS